MTLGKVLFVVLLPIGLISYAGIHLTELSLTHTLFGYDVDSLVTLAIVHTRELGLVAQLVEYLNAVYRLGRQRLDSGAYILAKELLAIDKNLLDGFTLCLYCSVGDGDTRHLL